MKSGKKSQAGPSQQWCRRVEGQIEKFIREEGCQGLDLVGPISSKGEKAYVLRLCREVYHVPHKIVTVGRSTYVSITCGEGVRLSVPLRSRLCPGREGSEGVAAPGPETHRQAAKIAQAAAGEGEKAGRAPPGRRPPAQAARVGEGEPPVWADESNIGMSMMLGMGWTKGKGIGKNEDGESEPLEAFTKPNTFGLGYVPKR